MDGKCDVTAVLPGDVDPVAVAALVRVVVPEADIEFTAGDGGEVRVRAVADRPH
jgi:hypothetical protein